VLFDALGSVEFRGPGNSRSKRPDASTPSAKRS